MFPCLELTWLSTGPTEALVPGQRWPLSTPFEIGRALDAQLVLPFDAVAPRHARLWLEQGQWWVQPLGRDGTTWLNSQRLADAPRALAHGDNLEVANGVVLRFLEHQSDPDLVSGLSGFVSHVLAGLDDPARWLVWGDRLQEQGHPLGERISRGAPASDAERAHWLGYLARHVLSGALQVEWRHGFLHRAVLRNVETWNQSFLPYLQHVLRHPAARFLEHLELDALSYSRGVERGELQLMSDQVVQSFDWLATALAPRPPLRTVRLGPFPQPYWTAALAGGWARLAASYPQLDKQQGPVWVARAAALELLATPPNVSVKGLAVGQRRPLSDDESTLIGPLGDCQFELVAPGGTPANMVACRLDREAGLWWLTDLVALASAWGQTGPLRFNGRPTPRERLRPGDLIEPVPGLLFRFELS